MEHMMGLSIKEIENNLKNTPLSELSARMNDYSSDDRGGVQKLITKYQKILDKHNKEKERLDEMFFFENKYRNECPVICGIDEVGRGPFAGPVVAGAVILPADVVEAWAKGSMGESIVSAADLSLENRSWIDIEGLNDSKQVQIKRRESLYEEIASKAVAYGLGVIPPARIDEVNIRNATMEAMKLAVEDLGVVPDLLLIDAMTLKDLPIRQVDIVKGDARSLSIAAASIVAKVTRDRMMETYAEVYPEYHFDKNAGYGTAEHIAALKEHGPCPIHRSTFIHNYV